MVNKKEKMLLRMQTLCAKAEHCTFEIAEKLRRAALPPPDCREIIEALRRDRFIDDARYANAFARDKARFSRWGSRKIYMHLCIKHIDKDMIRDAIAGVDPEIFMQSAMELARAKARTLTAPESYESRAKIYAYLASRGYAHEEIRAALTNLRGQGD